MGRFFFVKKKCTGQLLHIEHYHRSGDISKQNNSFYLRPILTSAASCYNDPDRET